MLPHRLWMSPALQLLVFVWFRFFFVLPQSALSYTVWCRGGRPPNCGLFDFGRTHSGFLKATSSLGLSASSPICCRSSRGPLEEMQKKPSSLESRLKDARSDGERLELLASFARQAGVDNASSDVLFATDLSAPHSHLRSCQWGSLYRGRKLVETRWMCVRGCSAHVYVQLALTAASDEETSSLRLNGLSDSLVVGGLLTLLAERVSALSLQSPDLARASLAEELLSEWKLSHLLPAERIQGFHQVVAEVQGQARVLLGETCSSRGKFPEEKERKLQVASTTSARNSEKISEESAAWPSAVSAQLQEAGLHAVKEIKREATNRLVGYEEKSLNLSPSELPSLAGAGEEVSVLLSGGVDSSTSILLLQEAGFRPRAFFLKVWSPEVEALSGEGPDGLKEGSLISCPWREDVEAARAAARHARVDFEEMPMQREYRERVLNAVLEDANQPSLVSLREFCSVSVSVSERLRLGEGHTALLRGKDGLKDQSYFLSGLSSTQLSRLLLPLGPLTKAQVRELATLNRLPSARRPDSQGLCFLGSLRLGSLLTRLLGEDAGPVYHFPSGRLVGRHAGLFLFTEGQRRGVVPLIEPRTLRQLHSPDGTLPAPSTAGPWLVVGKLLEAKALFVASHAQIAAANAFAQSLATKRDSSQGPLFPRLHPGEQRIQAKGQDEALLVKALKGHSAAQLAVLLTALRSTLCVADIRELPEGKKPSALSKLIYAKKKETASTLQIAIRHAARLAASTGPSGDKTFLDAEKETLKKDTYADAPPLIAQVRHAGACDGPAKHRVIPLSCSVQTAAASKVPLSSPVMNAEMLLYEADLGLAGGQVVAFYEGDECVGAGRVSKEQGQKILREILQGGPVKALRSALA